MWMHVCLCVSACECTCACVNMSSCECMCFQKPKRAPGDGVTVSCEPPEQPLEEQCIVLKTKPLEGALVQA